MLDRRGGAGEIEDRNGRGAEFGNSGPMPRNGRGSLREELDDEIPF
jgi:hypothetical protein